MNDNNDDSNDDSNNDNVSHDDENDYTNTNASTTTSIHTNGAFDHSIAATYAATSTAATVSSSPLPTSSTQSTTQSTTTATATTPATTTSYSSSSVQVAVRIRPILPSENGSHKCITVQNSTCIEIGAGGSKLGGNSKQFLFDACFSPKTSQREVFQHSVRPLVDACLDGYNATVLAYGQTGSGKTHTVLGPSAESGYHNDDTENDNMDMDNASTTSASVSSSKHGAQAGLIPRALRDLFYKLESIKSKHVVEYYANQNQSQNQTQTQTQQEQEQQSRKHTINPFEYEVRVQFLELYGEEIRDLLSSSSSPSSKLVIRDGVNHNHEPDVVGAVEIKVNNAAEALLCLTRGMLRRVTAATAMNAESSRSHAIMTVIVEQSTVMQQSSPGVDGDSDGDGDNDNDNDSNNKSGNSEDFESKRSKFHFVDLAGSERQKRSRAEGIRLKEGIDINKGLLVLGNVISALGDPKKKGKAFVPYRDSKLTRLLKGSLGGNHKTLMIACVSPSSLNMEESLNCLRYANRAKNIQNNATINVDAGSKLVTELRGQVQALATELLSVQKDDTNDDGKRFSTEILKKMANGNDTSNMNIGSGSNNNNNTNTNTNTTPNRLKGRESRKLNAEKAFLDVAKAEISILKQTIKELQSALASKAEGLFAAKAEIQYYRLQLNPTDLDVNGDGKVKVEADGNHVTGKEHDKILQSKSNFINQVKTYESEIARLKQELRDNKAITSTPSRNVDDNNDIDSEFEERNSTPKKNRLYSPKKKSKKKRNARRASEAFDKESKDEQKEIDRIAEKYINLGSTSIDDDDDDDNSQNSVSNAEIVDTEETFYHRQAHLDAHVLELTKGISAKEELIDQLKSSQTKYETMKNFYEDKLRKMTWQLRDQILEKNTLEVELRKYELNSDKYKDLQALLKAKTKHIEHLRNRQSEIENLTSIAARNESVIGKLKSEIVQMKQQKNTLQKQLMRERKDHQRSMQKLTKKASNHERDANKAKQSLAKTLVQKQRVQEIAKYHSEEVSKLRSKFRESEKKLRMQTLKRGVMERAGIDPVMVGRKMQGGQTRSRSRVRSSSNSKDKKIATSGDVHNMRSFLEDKVAEISRKEAAADKLAAEWEDHLELTTRKEEILDEAKGRKDSSLSDEIEALDFQIQYKESRIRQLSRRLSSAPVITNGNKDSSKFSALADDRKYKNITSEFNALAAAHLSSKVLFGMVVRERRRVAKLARTASALDQKVLNTKSLVLSNEAALRSHMEDSKNERVAMAQSHQEKILSLMSLLQQDQEGQDKADGMASPDRHESVILTLANERIDTLEKQLEDMQMEKVKKETYAARESETVGELTKITEDYRQLLDKSKALSISLSSIREKIIAPSTDLAWPDSKDKQDVLKLIDESLKKGTTSQGDVMLLKKSPTSLKKRGISGSKKSAIYETESEDEDEGSVSSSTPSWAGHIMEDLAIIAAGDVPASLRRTKTSHRPPISSSNGNVYDRLSNPDNYTANQKNANSIERNRLSNPDNSITTSTQKTPTIIERNISEDASVCSTSTYSTRSRTVRKDRASLMRVKTTTTNATSKNATPIRSRSRSNTPVRNINVLTQNAPTPFRHTTPAVPSRLTDRISGILKENRTSVTLTRELSAPEKEGNGKSAGGSVSASGSAGGGEKQVFINAYTKKDVFERLQKKVTNSYALAQKAATED